MMHSQFRARFFRTFLVLCSLGLTAKVVAATPGVAKGESSSGQVLYARLHLLPPGLQQSAVMMVYQQIDLKVAQWPMATPEDRLGMVKNFAMIFLLLEDVAMSAQWPEYAGWCHRKSDTYIGIANGSIPPAEGSKLLDAMNAEYDATFASYLRERFGSQLDVKPTPKNRELINDMTNSIIGFAEKSVAKEHAMQ